MYLAVDWSFGKICTGSRDHVIGIVVSSDTDVTILSKVFGYLLTSRKHFSDLDKYARHVRILKFLHNIESIRGRVSSTQIISCIGVRGGVDLLKTLLGEVTVTNVVIDDTLSKRYLQYSNIMLLFSRKSVLVVEESRVRDWRLRLLINIADHVVNIHRLVYCNQRIIRWV